MNSSNTDNAWVIAAAIGAILLTVIVPTIFAWVMGRRASARSANRR